MEWMVTILEIVPQNHYYVPRTYVRRETLRTSIFRYERLRRIRKGCYGLGMSRQAKSKSLAQRQWEVLAALVRLAQRFGEWPTCGEVAREMRVHSDTIRRVLKALEAEGLAACIRRRGWLPTAEGLRWRELEMPALVPGCSPPRHARWRGVGAIRAWNRKQRLRERLAAAEVFDRDAVSGGGEFEG